MSAKTVETSATSYLSASEFLKRVDYRSVADLVSDTGTRATQGSLSSDVNLAACLLDASGILEEACLVSGRYHPIDLAALTGAGQAALYRLLSRMTMCLLFERRPDREMKQPWIIEYVEDQLQKLRDGERVFSFVEAEQTGVAITRVETAQDVERRNGVTVQAQRYLGRRGNRETGPR